MSILTEVTDVVTGPLSRGVSDPEATPSGVLKDIGREAVSRFLNPKLIQAQAENAVLEKLDPRLRRNATNLFHSILKRADELIGIEKGGIRTSPPQVVFPSDVVSPERDFANRALDTLGNHYITFKILDTTTSSVFTEFGSGSSTLTRAEVDHERASITIFHPQELTVSYGKQWSETDFGVFRDFAAGAGLSLDLIKQNANLRTATQAKTSVAENLFGSLHKKYQHENQIARNPKLELLFEGVNFRQFSFSFNLAPKSEDEVVSIIAIIKAFKYASAPGLKEGGNFFTYPSKFEIETVSGDKFNTKYGQSVCTDVTVNYSPQGIWQTFENGYPVNVELSLQFTEIILMTKDKIAEGY